MASIHPHQVENLHHKGRPGLCLRIFEVSLFWFAMKAGLEGWKSASGTKLAQLTESRAKMIHPKQHDHKQWEQNALSSSCKVGAKHFWYLSLTFPSLLKFHDSIIHIEYIQKYIHTFVRTYVRTYVTYVHAMHACMHACIHTYIHTYKNMCICTHSICVHKNIYIYTMWIFFY